MNDQYVLVTHLRADRLTYQEAIRAIAKAHLAFLQGVADGSEYEAAIWAAVDLLPPELRTDLPAPGVKRVTTDEFEDLLG